MTETSQDKPPAWLACAGLALAVLAVYSPLWRAGFVAFDDNDYVTANDMVQHGLSWHGIIWAFTTMHASMWHPLTWLSYMLDSQLFGPGPRGFHADNILLHMASSALLFVLMNRLLKAYWPSLFIAIAFALHPQHVESVAWISERKDVLSTFFWMLAAIAYVRYAGAPGRALSYWASLGLFAAGLMAKPMILTLPLILLLLDYWPLRRMEKGWRKPVLEKIPFLVLSAGICLVTILVAQKAGAIKSLDKVPLGARLANIPVAYAAYFLKAFWPARLALLYPFRGHWPVLEIAGAAALLIAICLVVVYLTPKEPVVLTGWLWFVIMLAPVIGLVQVGPFAMADRYSYLSSTGLFLAVAWLARKWISPAVCVVAAICGGALTWTQAGYWQNSETLFQHALSVTTENPIIESDLGKVLNDERRFDEALPHLRTAVRLYPRMALAHYNLGQTLLGLGQVAGALEQFDIQTTLTPNDAVAQSNFGSALLEHGLLADAKPHLEKAVELRPDDVKAVSMLAWLLATAPEPSLRNGPQAVQLAQHALALSGDNDPKLLGVLAAALAGNGDFSGAVQTVRRAIQLTDPGNGPLSDLLRSELKLYRGGKPFRDTAKK